MRFQKRLDRVQPLIHEDFFDRHACVCLGSLFTFAVMTHRKGVKGAEVLSFNSFTIRTMPSRIMVTLKFKSNPKLMPESLRYVKICGKFIIPQEHNNIKGLQDIQKICLHFPESKFKAAMCNFSHLGSIYVSSQ